MEKEKVGFLLEKYFAGTLSEAEKNELGDYMNRKQNKDLMMGVMEDYLSKQGNAIEFDEKRFMPLLEGIFTADAIHDENESEQPAEPEFEYSQPGVSRGKKLWLFVILLLIIGAVGFYFFYYKRDQFAEAVTENSQPRKSIEVRPGSYKAILTLADGTTVPLDSTSVGSLGQQGIAKLSKTSAGEIKYSATGVNTSLALSNTLTTPRGGQYQVTLSDGSRVTLNASSSLTYPVAFGNTERSVTISGEAFFEVASNAKIPFSLNVQDIKIRVVGTDFNVNAYVDEPLITIALLKGSIKITKNSITNSLQPLQEAQFDKDGKFTLKKDIDKTEVMAWKNGSFKFTNADLETVMRQLGRWYDVDVEYEKDAPKDLLISAQIQRNADFTECIRLLKRNKVNSRLEGKTMVVMH
jgi:ferric-dicitrate binding protein FerR (iron transport regulator)